ncbi:MAG: adenylate kinase [Thermoprotei archaeon]
MKIVLVAVPGGGKTTIMNIVKSLVPDVKIVNYGDVMLEIAKERRGIMDRDMMRKILSVNEYRELQLDAAKKIGEIKGDVIIDTHVTIKMKGGYYPGLPFDVVRLMRPDMIVLLEFDPHDVIERRMKDITSSSQKRAGRDIETPEDIELQQEMNKYFAVAAANAAECIVKIINLRFRQSRPFEQAEKAARIIAEIISTEKSSRY